MSKDLIVDRCKAKFEEFKLGEKREKFDCARDGCLLVDPILEIVGCLLVLGFKSRCVL